MTVGGTVMAGSPVAALGLKIAPLTADLLQKTQRNFILQSSSAWSSTSSWLGLLGDLGPLAIMLYLWVAWKLWAATVRNRDGAIARTALLMSGLLGGVYSWLEEPGYTLTVAIIIGLTLQGAGHKQSFAEIVHPHRAHRFRP
jgi:hypothetical protein